MIFHVLLEKAEDGWIVAECPALPGCVSQGKDEEEALKNIKEAIQAWLWAEDQKAVLKFPANQVKSHLVAMLADGHTHQHLWQGGGQGVRKGWLETNRTDRQPSSNGEGRAVGPICPFLNTRSFPSEHCAL